MEYTREQRRTFIALACKIAWADGVVAPEEKEFIRNLAQRLAGDVVAMEEIELWLEQGVPDAQIDHLPPELGQLFYYEAMRLAEADGDLAHEELVLLEDIMNRVFRRVPAGTPLARIALQKRAVT